MSGCQPNQSLAVGLVPTLLEHGSFVINKRPVESDRFNSQALFVVPDLTKILECAWQVTELQDQEITPLRIRGEGG
jgi:hypothetical protein